MKKQWITFLLGALTIFTAGISFAEEVIDWKFQTGDAIYTNPVYAEGNVYFGSLDSTFYSINAERGEENWHFKTSHPIHSTAAVFSNGVCFESGNELFILDFQGQLLYQIPLYVESVTEQIDTWDFVHSSPNIVDGIAYIGTEQGWIYGINVISGEEVFKVQTPDHGTIRIKPAVENGHLYVGDWEGVLYCYDLATANILWQYDTKSDVTFDWTNAIQTPLLIDNGVIYFSGRSCRAYALDAVTGQKLWMYEQGNTWVVGGTVISDGLVYFGSSNQSLLYALNSQTGKSKWNASLDFRMWNAPLVSGDYLFFGSWAFYVMDKNTGNVVNRMVFDPDSVHKEPVHIYYWADDFYGTGETIANFHSSAIEVDGKIIVGCDDGILYAFNREAFIHMPKAETSINISNATLGTLENDSTYVVEVKLNNTGNMADSVSVTFNSSSALLEGIQFLPNQIEVPPGEEKTIRLVIDAKKLMSKSYILQFTVNSKYNIINNSKSFTLRFKVAQTTNIEEKVNRSPVQFNLAPNVPNPFNPSTRIGYTLPVASDVHLTVFDTTGREITTLVQNYQQAGTYEAIFDGKDLCSGIYVCMLEAGNQRFSQKMMLVK